MSFIPSNFTIGKRVNVIINCPGCGCNMKIKGGEILAINKEGLVIGSHLWGNGNEIKGIKGIKGMLIRWPLVKKIEAV